MTTRSYESGDLQVLWNSARCIHAAACIRALPRVFNPAARPWVRIDAAEADAIAAAIEHCPTGALRYVRTNGPTEAPDHPATIEAIPNGPLLLRGDFHVVTPEGASIAHETRLALCRCGASENKPFCDNAHRRIGFQSDDVTPQTAYTRDALTREQREDAESPADIGSEQPPTFFA